MKLETKYSVLQIVLFIKESSVLVGMIDSCTVSQNTGGSSRRYTIKYIDEEGSILTCSDIDESNIYESSEGLMKYIKSSISYQGEEMYNIIRPLNVENETIANSMLEKFKRLEYVKERSESRTEITFTQDSIENLLSKVSEAIHKAEYLGFRREDLTVYIPEYLMEILTQRFKQDVNRNFKGSRLTQYESVPVEYNYQNNIVVSSKSFWKTQGELPIVIEIEVV